MDSFEMSGECEWCYSPRKHRIVSVDGDVFYVCDRHKKECDPKEQMVEA